MYNAFETMSSALKLKFFLLASENFFLENLMTPKKFSYFISLQINLHVDLIVLKLAISQSKAKHNKTSLLL